MKTPPWRKPYHIAAIGLIVLFGLISLSCLTSFPYVHSDESWLAGLTRAMMIEKNPGVTEPFFDAKPRYPHGIKIVFHLLQFAALSVFGFRVFSVRLISWAAGSISLWLCYLTGSRFLSSDKKGLLVMSVLALDIQFLYASHFARQEILLSAVQWLCLWNLFSPEGFYNKKTAVILGSLTGISIGFHPNSFLLGTMNGLCFLTAALREKKNRWQSLILYVAVTGGFAAIFVGISLMMDPEFIVHYAAYGEAEFGTGAPLWEKLPEFFAFLKRLYRQNSGTYYLPNIRPQFFLFGISLFLTAALALMMKQEMPVMAQKARILITAVLGIALGMILIGRYNQTSILFFFPPGYLMVSLTLELFEGKAKPYLWGMVLTTVFFLTAVQVLPEIRKSGYDDYGRQIRELVPENAKVLGNLNTEFFMGYDCLRDYRNLPYVIEGEGLAEYLEENEIEYILYYQELDYLWEHRPYYNVIYGNVMFVQELKRYCEKSCEEVGSFQNSRYGIRVAGILEQEEYGKVTVYRRASSSSSFR